jgi:hypothetical protein
MVDLTPKILNSLVDNKRLSRTLKSAINPAFKSELEEE